MSFHSEAHAFFDYSDLTGRLVYSFSTFWETMSIEELDEGAKGANAQPDDHNTDHHADDAPCRGSLPGLVHDLFLLLFFTILLFLC